MAKKVKQGRLVRFVTAGYFALQLRSLFLLLDVTT